MRIRKEVWAIALKVQFLALLSTHAAPRWPLPPLPEFVPPLYQETFDADLYYGMTNAQIAVGNYMLEESWSGYALQRFGAGVTPFIVPAVDSMGHTNIACHGAGTIRVWFEPTLWSSGTGPGAVATLLELDAIVKNQSANVWSLQVSADGTTLSLVAQTDGNQSIILQTQISWLAQQSHLIVLDYSAKETALFIDGQMAAEGAGTPMVSPQITALMVGSSLTGGSVAGGDFDELYCFGVPPPARIFHPLTAQEVLFYYNVYAPSAALGPISADETAARQQAIASTKAQRSMMSASMSSLLPMGATSGLLSFGCACNCNCATGGQVYFTNLTATLTTNQGMVVSFNLAGGTNGMAYGVFTTTNIGSPNWKWIGNAYTCSTVYLTNQPADVAFYALGAVAPTMAVPWGDDYFGQCSYEYPTNVTNIVSVAAGFWHSIGLKSDGKVLTWGYPYGSATYVPTNLTGGVTAVAAGWSHNLALLTNRTVFAWGDILPIYPETAATNVPSNVTNVILVAANSFHNLALRCDGTVVGWGYYTPNGETNVPAGLSNIIAIAAGPEHDLAVESNGVVVAWGNNSFGQCNVPAGLSNVVDVAAGWRYSLALKKDGTVVVWGDNTFGQTNVPAGLSNVVAIAAGGDPFNDTYFYPAAPSAYSLALRSNGTVAAWGSGPVTNLPQGMNRVAAIAGGYFHAVGVRSQSITPVIIQGPKDQVQLAGGSVTFSGQGLGVANIAYQWQFGGANISGATNDTVTLTNVNSATQGSYQMVVSDANGSVTSSPALFTLVSPPVFISQSTPTNPVYIYGNYISLSAIASAPGQFSGFPITYQWQYSGTNNSNATNSFYGLFATDNSGGTYRLIASNAAGTNSVVWQVTITNAINVTNDLLLIYNSTSSDSSNLCAYYLTHRPMVSGANVLGVACTKGEFFTNSTDWDTQLVSPVATWLTNNPTKRPQYVILFYDIPMRLWFPDETGCGGFTLGDAVIYTGSVSYHLQQAIPSWKPFVNNINQGTVADCEAYVNKIAAFGSNSPSQLIVSARAGNYWNTNYILDNARHGLGYGFYNGTNYGNDDFAGFGSTISSATNGLIANGVSPSAIIYNDGLDTNGVAGLTAYNAPQITNATNVAGYICWGEHSALGQQYATNNTVNWTGNSSWWIIETIESFNGMRTPCGQGNFIQWFSSNAFGGTNYSNTPIGAVSSVEEPYHIGASNPEIYFSLWVAGKNFAICAWNSRYNGMNYFQAIGDPFVTK